ncbi:beaten path IIb isoform 1-T3 [Cochliomyia hominivorax]
MLLTLETNNSIKCNCIISNKGNGNSNKNNNNCLTSMTCLCGCISSCHSNVTITKTKSLSHASTSLTTSLPSSSSTATAASATQTETKIETTMKTSTTTASSSSTKDNSNYMHCENIFNNQQLQQQQQQQGKQQQHTCYYNNCGIKNKNNNSNQNSDNCYCNIIINTKSNSLYKTKCNSFRNCISNINNNLKSLIKFVIVLIFLTCCDLSQAALRDVNLFIEPPAVRRSQSVTLRCHYTIEGAPLYSVKFYRGQFEFYRYTPGEYPNTKVFHFPGIKVDESVSNATQVVIRNVNFGLSGTFSCEVTADAPLFSTATAYAQMQVVEFPDKRPQLFTEQTRYEPGDVLRANCSTPPSRPRAELRFTINNIPVSTEETQYIRTVDNLIASRLSLKVQLQALHFATGNSNSHMINALNGGGSSISNTYGGSSASGGALLLRCTAQIGDLYQEYKEIELGTPQKDPVPARVTSSGGGFRGFLETYFGPSSSANNLQENHQKMLVITFSLLLIIKMNFMPRR